MPHFSAEERRRQFVEAAVQVIRRVGLEKATTRSIAAEAKVPLSSLHYAFADKSALLAAVYEHIVQRDATMLETAIPQGCGLSDGVRILTVDYLDFLIQDEPMMMANYEIFFWSVRTPGQGELAAKAYAAYRELCVFALQRAAGEAVATNKIEALVDYLMNAIDGVVLQYMAQRDPLAARSRLALMASTAMDRYGLT